jgi:hypothetical protein
VKRDTGIYLEQMFKREVSSYISRKTTNQLVQGLIGIKSTTQVSLVIDLSLGVPTPPPDRAVYHWSSAPWNHMRREINRRFEGWDARTHDSVDASVVSFYGIVDSIIKKHVKSSITQSARPVPWWDRHCTIAQKAVDATFSKWGHDHDKHKSARKILKTRQCQAYAKYI